MIRHFVIITIAAFAVFSCHASDQFEIKKNLNTGEVLSTPIEVKVTETNLFDNGQVSIKVKIPKSIEFSDVLVFFANEFKSILQVSLVRHLQGKFFSVPYKIEKTMMGQLTKTDEEGNFKVIFGSFPKKWLPENCNKINAAVVNTNSEIYNYYDILNYKISIPDLLLVEEYKNYNP